MNTTVSRSTTRCSNDVLSQHGCDSSCNSLRRFRNMFAILAKDLCVQQPTPCFYLYTHNLSILKCVSSYLKLRPQSVVNTTFRKQARQKALICSTGPSSASAHQRSRFAIHDHPLLRPLPSQWPAWPRLHIVLQCFQEHKCH